VDHTVNSSDTVHKFTSDEPVVSSKLFVHGSVVMLSNFSLTSLTALTKR